MKKHIIKSNNRGATLVMVIISMLFIAIIATLVLSLTSKNLEAMQTGAKSSDNFYTTENAIDEVQSRLEEWADEAMRKAYIQWLQLYTQTPEAEQETRYKTLFANALNDILMTEFLDYFTGGVKKPTDLLYEFDESSIDWKGVPSVELSPDGTKVVIRNIGIEYTDTTGYASTITTDMEFGISYPGFKANAAQGMNLICSEFAIIADQQIKNNVTVSPTIKGSIYGGGYVDNGSSSGYFQDGIVFGDDSEVVIKAENIITRTGINILDGAHLVAKGVNSDYDWTGTISYCDIWAQNINLSGTSSDVNRSSMDVQGDCFISDDLTLDANASMFKLKGGYYGYNTNNASAGIVDDEGITLRTGTPDGSSAMVVNSADSVLDLTEASTIWIAGKTFVTVPSQFGAPASPDDVSFQQGESISYRGLQAAYLLPGDCVVGLGHNPMTADEYQKLKDGVYSIDIKLSRKKGGIRLEDYVQSVDSYRTAIVQYGASTPMVYLYLNFQNSDKASKYFQAYQDYYDDLVKSRMISLGDGKILFDPAVLVNTGNAIGYSDGNITTTDAKLKYNDPAVENRQIELASRFSGMVTQLDASYAGIASNGLLTDTIINTSEIVPGASVNEELELPNGTKYQLIVGDNVHITSNVSGAIVIATGNVYIENGASFTGLIVAKGSCILSGSGSMINADPSNVSYLIKNDEKVKPYFLIGESSTGSNSSIYASDLIDVTYDNWRKN